MSEKPYYYAQDGKQHGPVSLDEIRAMASAGVLKADDLVWNEGMASWTRTAAVPGLVPSPALSARSRRVSWKLVAVLAAVALAVLGGLTWRRLAAPSIDGLVRIVPRDANALLVVRGLPQLALELGLLGGGEAALLTALNDFAGLAAPDGPADQDSVLATGIDVTAPMGVSVQPGHQESLVYYLPIGSRERLRATLERFVAKNGWTLEERELGGRTLLSAHDGAFGAVEHQGYLVVAYAEDAEPMTPFFEKLVAGQAGTVAQADWFAAMAPLRDGPWHLLALANPGAETPLATSTFPFDPWSRGSDLAGLGLRLEVTSDAIRLRYQEVSRKGVEHALHRSVGNRQDRFAPRIAGQALAALRLSVDVSRLGEGPQQQGGWAQQLEELKQAARLEGDDDPLAGLGSPVSVAVLKGDPEAQMPVDVVAWIPLAPGHDVQTTAEQWVRSMRTSDTAFDVRQRGGTSWYELREMPMSWAAVDDHMVLAFRGSDGDVLADSGPSFLGSLKRQEVREDLVSSHDVALYVDLESVVTTFRAALEEGLSDPEKALLDSLGDLELWVDARPDELVSEWSVLARQPGGFAAAAAALTATGRGLPAPDDGQGP